MDDIDFISIFKNEIDDHIKNVTQSLLKLEEDKENNEIIKSLLRNFHTLKGAARAINFEEIKDISHKVEDIFHGIQEGKLTQRDCLIDLVFYANDLALEILNAKLENQSFDGHKSFNELIDKYISGDEVIIPEINKTASFKKEEKTENKSFEKMEKETDNKSENKIEEKNKKTNESLSQHDKSERTQVTSDLVSLTDSLLTLSGEITVAVESFEEQRTYIRKVSNGLDQLLKYLHHIIGIGSDKDGPLFKLSQKIKDLQRIQHESLNFHSVADTRFRVLSDELNSHVSHARLVSLDILFSTYPRLLRDLTKELNKKINFNINGGNIKIDRGILDAIKLPLMQIIRNSLDHGIEPPEERIKTGKSKEGIFQINATHFGDKIKIVISDDGRGIDMEAVKSKAITRNNTTVEMWNMMNLEEQKQFLFLPGFTTTETVSETSGRGVGLDIAKSEVEKVGGTIDFETIPGEKTNFIIELPLSLSLTRCVLAVGGKHELFDKQIFALPVNEISEIRRINLQDFRSIKGADAVRIENETIPLFDFARLMGLSSGQTKIEKKYLIIIDSGSRKIGLLVDDIHDEKHVLSRLFDTRLGKIKDFSGFTILNDGSMALILDIRDIMESINELRGGDIISEADRAEQIKAETSHEKQHVLVVEDSSTVREVERHFLEKSGFKVSTAVNGVDGLNTFNKNKFDLIITDIDMPRMNGIDMVKKIRESQKGKDIPIIIVSYKDREYDRTLAEEAGVNLYVTKSDFDSDEMINKIKVII